MRPCEKIHPVLKPNACRICWLWVNYPQHRERLGNSDGVDATAAVKEFPRCDFVGSVVLGSMVEKLKLSHVKLWVNCEHPEKPLGPIVCSCTGCGRSCPGYKHDPV